MKIFQVFGLRIIVWVLVVCQLTGCSTLMNRQNAKRDVFFDANVPGVQISCPNGITTTPGSVYMKISKTQHCIASKEGYEQMPIKVRSGLSGSGVAASAGLNLLWGIFTFGLGLTIGMGVDLISGAMRNFKKDKYFIEMIPVETAASPVVTEEVHIDRAVADISNDVVTQTPKIPSIKNPLNIKDNVAR